ncbi:LOW QUALITY PROTEIN: hypothetical protein M514_10673 [Trichuris suis]|uniref:DUF4371 domain-containing protein n=1 Tax=Trichuris suis TaxID=68888 RepID=A0A085LU09_9BILA|nr:LOW QUALITY PROTEIN: hypothetical protein M513_10673 [Trichuris suis]KFD62114.1 LOW QUALITY PROTEIN: hypothetical protein M514_10673 [Trichuris suis]
MLFARRIKTDVTGLSIFDEMKGYFRERNIPAESITVCATDGAACMVGRYRGFIAYLKKLVPTVFTVRCIIHREQLVSKNLGGRLQQTLSHVIQVVDFIKSRPHQDRLFHQLCEDFRMLLMHTEVRWLSKGNRLQRFATLWDSVVTFLPSAKTKKILEAKVDIYCLADMFQKLNSLNLALHGRKSNIVDSKEAIVSFFQKLEIYRHNIGRREFLQFPNLKKVEEAVNDDDLILYQSHLKQLRSDMEVRFKDQLELVIPEWVSNPFEAEPTHVEVEIQESLIDLRSDIAAILTTRQKHLDKDRPTGQVSNFVAKSRKLFIAFRSTYLVQCGFSRIVTLTKCRNRIDTAARGDLRLSLSNLEPNIAKMEEKHQPQGSH